MKDQAVPEIHRTPHQEAAILATLCSPHKEGHYNDQRHPTGVADLGREVVKRS